MNKEIEQIIQILGLQKLWENDFIKEGYSSDRNIKIDNAGNERPLFNWAYYLMTQGCIFPLHKLLSDESWQYCLGGAIDLFIISNHQIKTVRIGADIFNQENLYYVVPRNTWFAAALAPGSTFSLITHCVTPGWVPEDDIPGYYEDMLDLCPQEPDFIQKYSWPRNRPAYVMHESYKSI